MSRLPQPLVLRRHCWARMADHPTFAELGCLFSRILSRRLLVGEKHLEGIILDHFGHFGFERYLNMIFICIIWYPTRKLLISTNYYCTSMVGAHQGALNIVAASSPHGDPGEKYWASHWLLMYPANSLRWHWWNTVKQDKGMSKCSWIHRRMILIKVMMAFFEVDLQTEVCWIDVCLLFSDWFSDSRSKFKGAKMHHDTPSCLHGSCRIFVEYAIITPVQSTPSDFSIHKVGWLSVVQISAKKQIVSTLTWLRQGAVTVG